MPTLNRLSAVKVNTAPPGKYSDGGGLWLHKRDDGGAQWVLRVSVHDAAGRWVWAGLTTFR